MTYKEKFDSVNGDWRRKAVIVNLFHCIRSAKGSWTIRKTATYFCISNGYVCESLKIASHLKQVVEADNRQQALKLLESK